MNTLFYGLGRVVGSLFAGLALALGLLLLLALVAGVCQAIF